MGNVVPLTIAPTPHNRIAGARRASSMTRKQVAARLGVPKATVRAWEAAEAEIPVHHANALSQLFGITVPFLLGQVGLPSLEGLR